MKKIVFICLAQLLVMCSTTNFQVRDDFKSVSSQEKNTFLKQKKATSTTKSIVILTNGFKGEKMIAKQANKTIYSAYPITNLKTKYADSFSFTNKENLVIYDNFSKKELLLESKKVSAYKFIYIMKIITDNGASYKVTLSNTLRPLE